MEVGEGACRKEEGGCQQGLHLRERLPGTFKDFEKWCKRLPPDLWERLKKGM